MGDELTLPAELVEALTLLGADAEAQIEALGGFRGAAGSLATDEVGPVSIDELVAASKGTGATVPETVRLLVDRIDDLVGAHLDDPGFWSSQALREHPDWREVRALARRALMRVGR